MQQHKSINIGVVEDDTIMGRSLVQRFELDGHTVDWWMTGSDAVHAPEFFDKDIIICDIRLPDITGEAVLRQAGRNGLAPPFLFITAFGEIDQAVRLMKMGACDYITKPFEIDEFLSKVERSARLSKRQDARPDILGISSAMQSLQDNLVRFAQTDFPVLITGEVGAGKESAARFLHSQARTNGHPFMAVNCAAIPSELLECEIFGSADPEFAGLAGHLERVGSGTLYLNQVSLLSLPGQTKLLQLVEDHCYSRCHESDVHDFEGRLIVSNTVPLETVVKSGCFTENLSFRLSVLPVHVPPLRKRLDDVVWLLLRMIQEACSRQGQLMKSLSTQAEEAALGHDWPGNSFEMRNRIERAVALSRNHELSVEDLFPELSHSQADQADFQSLAGARQAAERRQIKRALKKASGQVGEAAKLLNISRTTLWEKMSKLNLRESAGSET